MNATKRTWRERRGNGLSETQYSGLELYLGDFAGFVIVTKLSHGLRVIDANKRTDFVFEGSETEVNITPTFYNAVLKAFEADMEFQAQLRTYRRLMS